MNESLKEMMGKQVRVSSISAQALYTDVGILESYDHPWLKLRKNDGKLLCFAAYQIRLVELY
ncbi:hypothetical protein EON80_10020 [bacterium]|nr:MAG: hypothetical protein EON80_10020 [bacterium]